MDIDTNPTYIFDIREMFLNYNYCRFLVSRLPADYPSLTTCLQREHIKCVLPLKERNPISDSSLDCYRVLVKLAPPQVL